ncbi:MAG: DUF3325 domain-containing protein [Pseudomonas sp.]|uniref:DUF3325 domain-containing protein n=1 Tax=Pseudomonas sp. TaxID=306 RepID=UPI0033916C9A
MLWISFVFAYMAMLAFCEVMPRHARVLLRSEPTVRRRWVGRVLGCLLLAVALWQCVTGLGTEIGLVVWCCLLMLAGLLLVAMLAWQPRWVRASSTLMLVVGLLLVNLG